ncbi:MAG: acetyl-CoA carboxylase carboxyl transferase subunit alpha, partial [Gammaproteobacteria bacterium]
HRDLDAMAQTLKRVLLQQLDALEQLPVEQLLEQRYRRLMAYGHYTER